MASKINRHVYSPEELLKLQNTLTKAKQNVEKAQNGLGQLKRSKISLQQKHNENGHKYRYLYSTFEKRTLFSVFNYVSQSYKLIFY